jgi:high-affinity nickel-transport protein
MTEPLALAVLGFVLGMRHATDADHVIAVSTIVSRHRNAPSALLIGAAWGVGHSLTVLVVGGGIILFGWVIPPRVGLSLELAVAVMLVVLGLANLGSLRHTIRRVPNGTGAAPVHSPAYGGVRLYQLARPLMIGVVHGLAGSAAVALLVLAAVREPLPSLIYLVLFGAGTIVGMTVITTAIAWPLAARPSARFAGGVRVVAGAVSLVFGCYLAYRVGVVDGLFHAPEF